MGIGVVDFGRIDKFCWVVSIRLTVKIVAVVSLFLSATFVALEPVFLLGFNPTWKKPTESTGQMGLYITIIGINVHLSKIERHTYFLKSIVISSRYLFDHYIYVEIYFLIGFCCGFSIILLEGVYNDGKPHYARKPYFQPWLILHTLLLVMTAVQLGFKAPGRSFSDLAFPISFFCIEIFGLVVVILFYQQLEHEPVTNREDGDLI